LATGQVQDLRSCRSIEGASKPRSFVARVKLDGCRSADRLPPAAPANGRDFLRSGKGRHIIRKYCLRQIAISELRQSV